MTAHRSFKLVVVGAGVSGLYTAWKCADFIKASEIAIVNRETSIGGRLLSYKNKFGHTLELGAMRIPSSHENTINLCRSLRIPLIQFNADIQTSPLHLSNPENVNKQSCIHQNASTFVGYAIARYCGFPFFEPKFKKDIVKLMLKKLSSNGIDINKLSLENWVSILFSQDEASYLWSLLGYRHLANRDLSFISCFTKDMINEEDFYYKPLNGMQEIATSLHKKFMHFGGQCYSGHSVLSISRQNEIYSLTTSGRLRLETEKLVLAIPPSSILKINNIKSILDQNTIASLLSIGSYASRKTYYTFTNILDLKKLNGRDGFFRTNLNLGIGHWDPCKSNISSNKQSKAILASYNNSDQNEDLNSKDYKLAYLKELSFCLNHKLNKPSDVVEINWKSFQSSVSAHYWKVGVDIKVTLKNLENSSPHIFFVGEAFNDQHGWIASGLSSSDRVIAQLKKFKWIIYD